MLWVEAFHVIFMVTWFAGLFYLPRLFVYHAAPEDEVGSERFKVMERKLVIIRTIGAVGTLVFGLWLLFTYAWSVYASTVWLPLKLAAGAGLVAYHLYCAKLVADFRHDRNRHSHVFYRWINELPAILLILMVILVVVKPF